MRKLRVFISSALDELEYEREIARKTVESLKMEPVLFEGLPAMSKTLESAYLDEVKRCDLFVSILWKSFRPAVEREYDVALEHGKPILIFVKMLKEGEAREESLLYFLGHVVRTNAEGNANLQIRFYRHYRSLRDLARGLSEGIIGEIANTLAREPIMTHTRQEMYELGTSIVKSAKKRLYIAQQTPSLLFGPRNYDHPNAEKVPYEVAFCAALEEWIGLLLENRQRECICFYNVQSTTEEIGRFGAHKRAAESLKRWKQKEKNSGYQFRFTSAPSRFSGPMAVGDNWFAVWLMGQDNAVCISHVNEQMADIMAQLFRQTASRITTDQELLAELGLD